MVNNNNSIKIIIAILPVVIFASCRIDVPIREMTRAKRLITAANKVNAKKYAPDLLSSATNKLLTSHKQLSNDEIKKCRASAEESANFAISAYKKSIPLLSKDTIDIAENNLEKANEAYAERLASQQYYDADGKLKQANNLFQNKNYYESYLMALSADTAAINARNVALGKSTELSDSIVEVKRNLEEAENYGARKYAADKFKLGNENISIAEEAYRNQDLRKGFSALEIAKSNADEALIFALKGTAKDKIAKAEQAIFRARKYKLSSKGKIDFDVAEEALEYTKSIFTEDKYRESIIASDEAIRYASKAIKKYPDGTDIAEGRENNEDKSPLDMLDDYVRALKDSANIAYNIPPDRMKIGDVATIELVLNTSRNVDDLKKEIQIAGNKEGATIQINDRVTAKINHPGFKLLNKEDVEREESKTIRKNFDYVWEWSIQAEIEGPHIISIVVNTYIDKNGKSSELPLAVYKKNIQVIQVYPTLIDNTIDFIKQYWQWIMGAIIIPILTALWAWLKNKFNKKKKGDEEMPLPVNNSNNDTVIKNIDIHEKNKIHKKSGNKISKNRK